MSTTVPTNGLIPPEVRLKSEIKVGTAHDIGVRLDDLLENAKGETLKWEGAESALGKAIEGLEGLFKHVETDLEEGKLSGLEPLQVVGAIKRYIERASNLAKNLRTQARLQKEQSRGKAVGLEQSVTVVKNVVDKEQARLLTIAQGLREGAIAAEEGSVVSTSPGHVVGVRPIGIAAQRKAEDAAASVDAAESPTKRRGRPPKVQG
jgi:hypothetical protein